MSKDTGGSAFPRPADKIDDGCEGMTLRDLFAGQALIGIIIKSPIGWGYHDRAEFAKKQADAMIEELNK